MQSLYQQTGAPIHSAYALPQLLTFYKNETNTYATKVCKWQSISSICLHRWMGGGEINIPISYSEARCVPKNFHARGILFFISIYYLIAIETHVKLDRNA